MSSANRLLAVLRLFSDEKPVWTVEQAAPVLGVSTSTAYRYFNSLREADFLDPVSGAGYRLGSAFIHFDRQIRISDPLLLAAQPLMKDMIPQLGEGSIAVLCRRYQDSVMCVHQEIGPGPQSSISYERGRPLPMFRGASSKVILANLSSRTRKQLYENNRAEIAASGLGSDWAEFKRNMQAIRRRGYDVTAGEVDPHRIGVAAPVFNGARDVLGSISAVGWAHLTDKAALNRAATLVTITAGALTEAVAESGQAYRHSIRTPSRRDAHAEAATQ